jgi:hypothetical protein
MGEGDDMNKVLGIAVSLVFWSGMALAAQEGGGGFLNSAQAYFGQTPPGDKPILFAPGVISNGNQDLNTCSFSADGKTLVFTRWMGNDPRLVVSRFENAHWTEPADVNFTGQFEMEGIFAPFGNRLFFAAGSMQGRWAPDELWMEEKLSQGWSSPVKLDALNTDNYEFFATQTLDGTVFFQRSTGVIYTSASKNGAYQKPVPLTKPFNVSSNSHPAVSPDGSALVVEIGGDLWVSFKASDGGWSELKKLGSDINTQQSEGKPVFSPDGKYLFFSRAIGAFADIYWVSMIVLRS